MNPSKFLPGDDPNKREHSQQNIEDDVVDSLTEEVNTSLHISEEKECTNRPDGNLPGILPSTNLTVASRAMTVQTTIQSNVFNNITGIIPVDMAHRPQPVLSPNFPQQPSPAYSDKMMHSPMMSDYVQQLSPEQITVLNNKLAAVQTVNMSPVLSQSILQGSHTVCTNSYINGNTGQAFNPSVEHNLLNPMPFVHYNNKTDGGQQPYHDPHTHQAAHAQVPETDNNHVAATLKRSRESSSKNNTHPQHDALNSPQSPSENQYQSTVDSVNFDSFLRDKKICCPDSSVVDLPNIDLPDFQYLPPDVLQNLIDELKASDNQESILPPATSMPSNYIPPFNMERISHEYRYNNIQHDNNQRNHPFSENDNSFPQFLPYKVTSQIPEKVPQTLYNTSNCNSVNGAIVSNNSQVSYYNPNAYNVYPDSHFLSRNHNCQPSQGQCIKQPNVSISRAAVSNQITGQTSNVQSSTISTSNELSKERPKLVYSNPSKVNLSQKDMSPNNSAIKFISPTSNGYHQHNQIVSCTLSQPMTMASRILIPCSTAQAVSPQQNSSISTPSGMLPFNSVSQPDAPGQKLTDCNTTHLNDTTRNKIQEDCVIVEESSQSLLRKGVQKVLVSTEEDSQSDEDIYKRLAAAEDEDGGRLFHYMVECYGDALLTGSKEAANTILYQTLTYLQNPILQPLLHHRDYMWQTPLHLAAKLNLHRMVTIFICYRANITRSCKQHTITGTRLETPLHLAVVNGEIAIKTVQALLVNGKVDLNERNSEGETVLHMACKVHGSLNKHGQRINCNHIIQVVMENFQKESDFNAQESKMGRTALMLAVLTKDLNFIEEFVSHVPGPLHHVVLNCQDPCSNSCMHYAGALRGMESDAHIAIVLSLLRHGGDADQVNRNKYKARDYAPDIFNAAFDIYQGKRQSHPNSVNCNPPCSS